MTTPTKNKHGRVGVRRRRPTTNQALRQRNTSLERRHQQMLQGMVPTLTYQKLANVVDEIYVMTAKSKTGVARKVHDYVAQWVEQD